MPRKRKEKPTVAQAPEQSREVPKPAPSNNDPDSLRLFLAEAEEVDLVTRTNGWQIISRDIFKYRDELARKIPYLNPKSSALEEARVLFIACDKLIGLVEDYAQNRKIATEFLAKLDNQEGEVTLDVDNENS